jgi:hypothetical protein
LFEESLNFVHRTIREWIVGRYLPFSTLLLNLLGGYVGCLPIFPFIVEVNVLK